MTSEDWLDEVKWIEQTVMVHSRHHGICPRMRNQCGN